LHAPVAVAPRRTAPRTEAVYRRYAIVSESDLRDAAEKLAALHAADRNVPRKVVPFVEGR
jgi:hypothetical protein